MRRLTLLSIAISLFSFAPPTVAHPGGTAADGCHYCRSNCDRWGVPWNERHCHGRYQIDDLRFAWAGLPHDLGAPDDSRGALEDEDDDSRQRRFDSQR